MNIDTFITCYREAFGKQTELPIAFWYSDRVEAPTEKVPGCLFKCMERVRSGQIVSLDRETIACGGGKLYTGFAEMPAHVPQFVSLKERYKQTPQMVVEFIKGLQLPQAAEKSRLHFARIDRLDSFDKAEGILFLSTPDQLSGLVTWAFFDNNAPDAVSAPFGSGCCSIITQAIAENRKQGRRTFLGLFDPSARPYFDAGVLSFTIPMSRFREMCHTLRSSCLFGTHAWEKIKARMQPTPPDEVPRSTSPLTFSLFSDIYLQEVRLEDAAAIYHAIDTHRDYLRRWLPFVDGLRSTADEEAFLRQVLAAPAERHEPIFGIRNRQHELCGLVGFHFTDFDNRRTELGYWLLPEYQHRGIVTESVRRLCLWAVQEKGMKRIQIRCAAENAASNAIPLRLGFVREGTERCGELLASGVYTDVHVYSLLEEEVLAWIKS